MRKGRRNYSKSALQAESRVDVAFSLATEQWRTRISASSGPFHGSRQQGQSTWGVCFFSFAHIPLSYLLHYCFVSSKEGANLISSPWHDKSQIQNAYRISKIYSDL